MRIYLNGCICSNKDKNFKANHNYHDFVTTYLKLYL